MNYSHVTA